MPPIAAVILAAGQGTRMKSDLPKVLHEACGKPLVTYVLAASRTAGAARQVVIVGYQAERVRSALAGEPDVEFAVQEQQLGTGDAVKAARPLLDDHQGAVLVLAGDMPLVTAGSLQRLLDEQSRHAAACVVGTAETEQNQGLGRIVRDVDGTFLRIVEERDATDEEKQIREINTGCYAFRGTDLFEALDAVQPENEQAEYYLTDCAEILRRAGKTVRALNCFDITEAIGVNTPEQLAEVERVMREARAGGTAI
jgi:bifunctional UDP-N-acetylglucosamine pyrophosphorylase/glucosamine-1-phosphate N-acetyltransferase